MLAVDTARVGSGVATTTLRSGLLRDLEHTAHPSRVRGFVGAALPLADEGTHFGVLFAGVAKIRAPQGGFPLVAGMWFSLPSGGTLVGHGEGVVATRLGWRGLFQVGGPMEPLGRLDQPDGCSHTVLVAPPGPGDPWLGHVHVPSGTRQRRQAWDRLRVGLVLRGHGICEVDGQGERDLHPGLVFVIEPLRAHALTTGEASLDVAIYDPEASGPVQPAADTTARG